MAVASVRLTTEGLQVPEETLQELGLRPGEEARIEIRRLPDAEQIRYAAMRHAWRKLGDAVGIGEPVWEGEVWKVALRVRDREGVFGHLYFSPQGEVLLDRSTTKQELHEALHAAST